MIFKDYHIGIDIGGSGVVDAVRANGRSRSALHSTGAAISPANGRAALTTCFSAPTEPLEGKHAPPKSPVDRRKTVTAPGLSADKIDSSTISTCMALPPTKTRTRSFASTCSVATEQGNPETRDVTVSEIRGEDCLRDSAVGLPQSPMTEESISREVFVEPYVMTEAVDKTRGETGLGQYKSEPGYDNSERGSCSELPVLTRAGNNMDSCIEYFYSSLELGAERACESIMCSREDADKARGGKEERVLLANDYIPSDQASVQTQEPINEHDRNQDNVAEPSDENDRTQQRSITNTKSEDSVKTENPAKTQGTPISIKIHGFQNVPSNATPNSTANETHSHQFTQEKSCCWGLSVFGCSCQEDKELEHASIEIPPVTIDEIISDTLNIANDRANIFDSFASFDNTIESDVRSQRALECLTPKAKILLNEIESIEQGLYEVRNAASMENIDAIKKRQDPFIDKMATIKRHLLEQQTLLQAAPEETKEDFFRAISRAAVLNAEVETRRAELELKKIRLETLKIKEEMKHMEVANSNSLNSFYQSDSLDDTLMSGDSEGGFQSAFNIFARYTAKKWHKMKKKGSGTEKSSECR